MSNTQNTLRTAAAANNWRIIRGDDFERYMLIEGDSILPSPTTPVITVVWTASGGVKTVMRTSDPIGVPDMVGKGKAERVLSMLVRQTDVFPPAVA